MLRRATALLLAATAAVLLSPPSAHGENIKVWQGDGLDNLSSIPGNWSDGELPGPEHTIRLDGTSSNDLVWDAAATHTVAGWEQTDGYTGTVTFETVYDEEGFSQFTITGDAVINGGTWTHPANSDAEVYRLKVSVGEEGGGGGDFLLGTDGKINVNGKGYRSGRGPGVGPGGRSRGASHGGRGYHNEGPDYEGPTYGSVTDPVMLGSGGGESAGGGAVRISARGTMKIDGEIRADGLNRNLWLRGCGSGGSVNITAGAVSGEGAVSADGGGVSGDGGGGGGRIAVILSSGTDFDAITFTAFGGRTSAPGAAGTIYLETASDAPGGGKLIIYHTHTPGGGILTELPASHETWRFPDELKRVTLIVRNRGAVGLTEDITVGDLIFE